MDEIRLQVRDRKDVMILWCAVNNSQVHGRAELVRNATGKKEIDGPWFEEAVDEFDRCMSLKAQLEKILNDEVGR